MLMRVCASEGQLSRQLLLHSANAGPHPLGREWGRQCYTPAQGEVVLPALGQLLCVLRPPQSQGPGLVVQGYPGLLLR